MVARFACFLGSSFHEPNTEPSVVFLLPVRDRLKIPNLLLIIRYTFSNSYFSTTTSLESFIKGSSDASLLEENYSLENNGYGFLHPNLGRPERPKLIIYLTYPYVHIVISMTNGSTSSVKVVIDCSRS